jgi:nicotinamidase-related amidase
MDRNPKRSKALTVVILALLFGIGLACGAAWHRSWAFPFPQLAEMRKQRARRAALEHLPATVQPAVAINQGNMVTIPALYFPGPNSFEDEDEKPSGSDGEYGHVDLRYRTDEVALVLIDIWNSRDPAEGDSPTGSLRNKVNLVNACRKQGITVIHAPSRPVVFRYKQYKKINKLVTELIANHTSLKIDPDSDYRRWPPPDYFNEAWKPRHVGRATGWSDIDIESDLDISRFLTPLKTEYVVFSFDEFRYVLWKEKIRVILYAGSSLNECMLHRDPGLNHLAGIDTKVAPFVLVVMADCSDAFGTPFVAHATSKHVMLHYIGSKLAFISDSRELNFETAPESSAPRGADGTVLVPQDARPDVAMRIFERPPK